MQLIEHNQFDTIYHEHFSYLSLLDDRDMAARQEFTLFVRIGIHYEADKVRLDAAIIEKGIALSRGAISGNSFPLLLRLQQKL